MINFEQEASNLEASNDQLHQLSTMVQRAIHQQRVVDDLEERFKQAKKDLARLLDNDIPTMMDAIGLSEVKTPDGTPVSIKDTLYASVPKKNKRAAAEWLMTHGHGSLVGETVSLAFQKGDGDQVQKAILVLEEANFNNYSIIEDMNTGSIKAMIKELTAQGQNVPLDLFGAHWKRSAEVGK